LLIEPHAGHAVTPDEVRSFLVDRVVKWWLPDAIVIGPVPLTATRKIDKKVIRERYRDHLSEAPPQVR
jgi:fatty-acyl-CoA synthase